jgi:hypothetical protein
LALFLQTLYEYIEPLKADMIKYGSLKKAIEVQTQKLKNLESQSKPIEVKRDSTNIPKNEINDDGKASDSNTIPFSYPLHSLRQIKDYSGLSTNSTYDDQASC